jgi:predicted DNA-binding transcriptional regulator AlpA
MVAISIPAGRELLDPQGAANYLSLKVSSLADMRVRGEGPRFCKAGRYVRYRLADLDAWLDGRTFQSTSEAKGV